MHFDGVYSWGHIKHHPRLVSFTNATKKTLTVEVWIKPDGGDEDFARLQTIAMLGHMGWGLQLMCPKGAGLGCCGSHLIRSVGFLMPGDNLTNDTCANTMSSNKSVPLGKWTHVAVVVNGTDWNETVTNLTAMGGDVTHPNISQATVTFYIDGQEAGRFVNNTAFPTRLRDEGRRASFNNTMMLSAGTGANPDLYVGRLGSVCNCVSYRGSIDELRLWEGPLASGDVMFWNDYFINIWHNIYSTLAIYVEFNYDAANPTQTKGLSIPLNANETHPLQPPENPNATLYLNGTAWSIQRSSEGWEAGPSNSHHIHAVFKHLNSYILSVTTSKNTYLHQLIRS